VANHKKPKNLQKPIITLIIASSVDGCLVTRESDRYDKNKNWKNTKGVGGYVQQFFDFSVESSDTYNLINASTLVNIGVNSENFVPKKSNVQLIVLNFNDNLTEVGLKNASKSVKKLILIGKKDDQFIQLKKFPKNCEFLITKNDFDIAKTMRVLKSKYKVEKITVQSAGLLSSKWLSSGVVDFLTIILYPIMVGNNGTHILSDLDFTNDNSNKIEQFFNVRPLKLIKSRAFDTNYLFLRYAVLN
jgi:2,5-diamino-6-(ribosylamino)-4(3H)-pyrimidinone 5'-phosphate reductase